MKPLNVLSHRNFAVMYAFFLTCFSVQCIHIIFMNDFFLLKAENQNCLSHNTKSFVFEVIYISFLSSKPCSCEENYNNAMIC